jgi:competence protein ComEC
MTLLTYWGIAWLIGIWLSARLVLPLYAWAGAALVALLAARFVRRPRARLLLGCAVALALGAARFVLAQPDFDEHSLSAYNDRGIVTLVGVVAAEPDVRDDCVYYKLDAKTLTLEGDEPSTDLPLDAESPINQSPIVRLSAHDKVPNTLSVHGAARLRGARYPLYAYGDRLRVHGELETPSEGEDFSYRDYLARKNIYSYIPSAEVEWLSGGEGSAWKRTLLSFKRKAQATIARIIPDPEASLLTGILLGVDTGLPGDVMDDFSATGTTHVIAISGFNISIVVALLLATLGRLVHNRWLAAGSAILGVVIYTILVGADAAVVRAAVMGVITVIGLTVGRQGVALNSLAAAAIVMTALNPYTWWDAGFQLSVAATLGLILYSELFEESTQRLLARKLSAERAKQVVGWISEALLLTLAAQITTTPLILYHFGRFSVITLLTNALILPVQSLIMFFGGAATFMALLIEPLGRVVGWGAYVWLTWTIRVVQWTARFPYASVPLELSEIGLVAVYAVIGGLTGLVLLAPERRRAALQGLRERLPLKLALSGMALATVVAWFAILQFPDGKLHVAFLDVGQGDAIFIETPGGVQILVDGGPEGSVLLSELGRHMPFWDRSLDMVVLTHPDADHLSGLVPALERYGVRAVVTRRVGHESELVTAWEAVLAEEGATLIRGEAGTRLDLSDGVTLEILHPGPELVMEEDQADTNDNSVVVRLTYGEVAFLLTGDIEARVERNLVRSDVYLHSTVLKVGHHGSESSSTQAFLDAVRPQVAVISVGQDNRFGHPAGEVLARLEGALVYRTDEDGTVTISSDGRELWIETER